MIAFDLECSNGHLFEGWFDNLQSYEDQNKKKMIICPYCEDTNIKKILSPVALKTKTLEDLKKDQSQIDYRKLAREVVEYINNEFEDLGADFTKEALKIHYGVAEKRNIKGTASAEEEKVLEDEGVQFFKIPVAKEDKKKKN